MSPTLPPLLADRFQVLRVVGEGAHGEVFLARDRTLGREVAVKVLRSLAKDAHGIRERFVREANLLVRHPHPCITPVLDASLESDPPFMVFHWMPGGDLNRRVARGAADLPEVVAVGTRLAGALAHLHRHGVIHRDVKLENVLLDEAGEAYLADLGLGRSCSMEAITRTGHVVGTPRYMAPEVIREGTYSPSTDLFALGVALIELAAGKRVEGVAMMDGQLDAQLDALSHPDLVACLRKAVAVDPAERWTGCAEFAAALGKLEGEFRSAPTDTLEGVTMERPVEVGKPSMVSTAAVEPIPDPAPLDRLRLLAPVVFVCLLLGWLALRSGEEPGPAAPPALDDREPRAALERNLERMLRRHTYPDGVVRPALRGGTYREHEAEIVRELLDPRHPMAWRRLLESLDEWAAAFPSDEAGRRALDRGVREDILVKLHHLGADQMVARVFIFRVTSPLGRATIGDPVDGLSGLSLDQIQAIQARSKEVGEMLGEAVESGRLLGSPPGPFTWALRHRLVGLVVDRGMEEEVSRALAATRAGGTALELAHLYAGGLTCLPSTLHADDIRCEVRWPFYQEAVAFTREARQDVPGWLRLELACDLILHWFTVADDCTDDNELKRDLLRDALEVVERDLGEDPSLVLQVLTFALHQEATSALVGVGDGSEAEMNEISRLRTRALERVQSGRESR